MHRPRLTATLVALALAAAACGNDTADDSADTGSTAPDITAADGAATDESTPADDEPPTDDGDDELTDSFRGVTADTITLGVAVTDVSQFAATGDVAPRYQALADATNERGGVGGRQVELIFESWEIADTTGAEAACVALTEDQPIFLVLGYLIPNFSDATCFTDLHDTIVINATLIADEDVEVSEGRLLSTFPDDFDLLLEALPGLASELDGTNVGVYGNIQSEAAVDETSDLLESLGADVVAQTLQSIPGAEDLVQAEAELDSHVQRWLAEGVEWLVNVDGAVAGSLPALSRAGATDLTVVVPTIRTPTLTALGADLTDFDDLIGIGAPVADTLAEQGLYALPECIETVSAGTGQTIGPFPPEGDDEPLPTTMEVCASWDVFVTLAEAAGPNLTDESFLQAGYALGPFPVTGSPSATVEPGRAHVRDADSAIYVYDADAGEFVTR